jgi:excisionase family DNA binding protein
VTQEHAQQLVRVREAARILNISKNQVRHLVHTGELAVVLLGGEGTPWLISIGDLLKLIERKRRTLEEL